ncbi:21 kDa protein-like [Rhododendron vialii]|uniref:21 kDa protein-like n=1 Tax=Rhododendron vialii TaxID=182163 RepID=UPI00265F73C2|nr:21 kDa protein-like [Rhododendron vialii]
MARTSLPLLALIVSLSYTAVAANDTTTELVDPMTFIEASCSATTYPPVCIRTLSKHAREIQERPHRLVQTALTEALARVETTKANMLKLTNMKGLKPMEYGALKDCLDQVAETVDRLSQSARELEKLGQAQGEDFSWHKSNVETWTNEALNQVRACVGGFSGQTLDGKIKDSVQAQTTKVGGLISMVLELVQQFEGKKLSH